MKEGLVDLRVWKSVFFNPEMAFCRDVSSLAVGALQEKVSVCDGMCASGARGIRYALENDNVSRVAFVDVNKRALRLARLNVERNRVANASFHCEDFNEFVLRNHFSLLEVDPFGSPMPFLHAAAHSFSRRKGILSVTATDVAVLCGAHASACLKNYASRPMNNEFCHEAGARILISSIARKAASFNLGVAPLFTLSKRHYMKLFMRIEPGAVRAVESSKKALSFVFHCPKCLAFSSSSSPSTRECACGGKMDWGGPLWLGELHEASFIKRMAKLNEERGGSKSIARLLELLEGECGAPAFYHDIHKLAEKKGRSPPSMEEVLERLNGKGFAAQRTHFKGTGVKTNASAEEVSGVF